MIVNYDYSGSLLVNYSMETIKGLIDTMLCNVMLYNSITQHNMVFKLIRRYLIFVETSVKYFEFSTGKPWLL